MVWRCNNSIGLVSYAVLLVVHKVICFAKNAFVWGIWVAKQTSLREIILTLYTVLVRV